MSDTAGPIEQYMALALQPVMFGGNSIIVDYQGRVLTNHKPGGGTSYAGAIIDYRGVAAIPGAHTFG